MLSVGMACLIVCLPVCLSVCLIVFCKQHYSKIMDWVRWNVIMCVYVCVCVRGGREGGGRFHGGTMIEEPIKLNVMVAIFVFWDE